MISSSTESVFLRQKENFYTCTTTSSLLYSFFMIVKNKKCLYSCAKKSHSSLPVINIKPHIKILNPSINQPKVSLSGKSRSSSFWDTNRTVLTLYKVWTIMIQCSRYLTQRFLVWRPFSKVLETTWVPVTQPGRE